eukprot:764820-Hanusia_phi.AAC.3
MSDSSAPLGSVKISVVRSLEGQRIMERFRAQKRMGNVDTRLSQKVKGTLLGNLAPFIDGSEGDSVASSKVLKINLDLVSYAARRALQVAASVSPPPLAFYLLLSPSASSFRLRASSSCLHLRPPRFFFKLQSIPPPPHVVVTALTMFDFPASLVLLLCKLHL